MTTFSSYCYTASALSEISKSVAENLEFYQILTTISATVQVSSRQNFATFLLLLDILHKHLKEFGGKPAITMTLLLLSQQEPVLGQIYQLLAELASPIKSINIGSHIGDLFIDEAVVRAICSVATRLQSYCHLISPRTRYIAPPVLYCS